MIEKDLENLIILAKKSRDELDSLGCDDEFLDELSRGILDSISALVKVSQLIDFIKDVAGGPHNELCPLEHPAYRGNWCHTCEAKKLLSTFRGNKQDVQT